MVDKSQFENQMSQYRLMIDQNNAEIKRLYDLVETRNRENEYVTKEVERFSYDKCLIIISTYISLRKRRRSLQSAKRI